jgi:chromosome segregation ATPase
MGRSISANSLKSAVLTYLYKAAEHQVQHQDGRTTRVISTNLDTSSDRISNLLTLLEKKELIWRDVKGKKTYATGLTAAGVEMAEALGCSPDQVAPGTAKKAAEERIDPVSSGQAAAARARQDGKTGTIISDLNKTIGDRDQHIATLKARITELERKPIAAALDRVAELQRSLEFTQRRIAQLEQAYSDARAEVGTERARADIMRGELRRYRSKEAHPPPIPV